MFDLNILFKIGPNIVIPLILPVVALSQHNLFEITKL